MKRVFTQSVTDLTARKRKSMQTFTHVSSFVLRQCAGRLQGYTKGAEPVLKLIGEIDITVGTLEQLRSSLLKAHKFKQEPFPAHKGF
jgi:hypothetical protein